MTPWTIAYQAYLSLGFPRKEYWGGLLFPSQGDLPDPRIEPASVSCIAGSLLHWQASCLSLSQQESTKCPYAELKSFSSVQFSHSVVSESFDPLNRSTPGLPVHHQLPEFTQTHIHGVSDAIQPSHLH